MPYLWLYGFLYRCQTSTRGRVAASPRITRPFPQIGAVSRTTGRSYVHPVHQAGSAMLNIHALHGLVCSCRLPSAQPHAMIEVLSSGHEGPHAALNTPMDRAGRFVAQLSDRCAPQPFWVMFADRRGAGDVAALHRDGAGHGAPQPPVHPQPGLRQRQRQRQPLRRDGTPSSSEVPPSPTPAAFRLHACSGMTPP